jgi:hypothetical protein
LIEPATCKSPVSSNATPDQFVSVFDRSGQIRVRTFNASVRREMYVIDFSQNGFVCGQSL